MFISRKVWTVLVALSITGSLPVFAQLSDPVKSVDNIPPEPVFGILAIDTPEDEGESITVQWNLSPDDTQSFAPFGDTFVTRGGVQGYRIYRSLANVEEAVEELVGTVGPGINEYIDASVEKGTLYAYLIRPYDLDNETNPLIDSGSEADLARIAQALNNNQPLAEDGTPIVSWFSREGNSVGFSDFFLFAENFGRSIDGGDFDPLFDIVVNQRIDFDDFFRFSEDFGKVIANVGEFQAELGQ